MVGTRYDVNMSVGITDVSSSLLHGRGLGSGSAAVGAIIEAYVMGGSSFDGMVSAVGICTVSNACVLVLGGMDNSYDVGSELGGNRAVV